MVEPYFRISPHFKFKIWDNYGVVYHIPTGITHLLVELSTQILTSLINNREGCLRSEIIESIQQLATNQYNANVIDTHIRQLKIIGILESSSNP